MATQKPVLTPENILAWLLEGQENEDINQLLTECHEINFADRIALHSSADAICYALTTNNVKNGNREKFEAAVDDLAQKQNANNIMPVGEIIALIIEVIKILIELSKSSKCCKKKEEPQQEVLELIKKTQNNPFLNLAKATLKSNFENAQLKYANFTGANLSGSNFSGADLSEAKFLNANLTSVDFTDADLTHADLRWANLKDAKIEQAQLPKLTIQSYLETKFPDNIKFDATPEVYEIELALQRMHDVAQERKNRAIEPRLSSQIEGHKHRAVVAENLVKLSKTIEDLHAKHYFLTRFYSHPFFSEHRSAKFANNVNSAIMHAAHLFGKNRVDPYIGSTSQEILRHAMKTCTDKIESEQKKILSA